MNAIFLSLMKYARDFDVTDEQWCRLVYDYLPADLDRLIETPKEEQ